MDQIFTVDVWWSKADHTSMVPNPQGDDWRRVIVAAPNATTANLIACQMVGRHGMAVASTVLF